MIIPKMMMTPMGTSFATLKSVENFVVSLVDTKFNAMSINSSNMALIFMVKSSMGMNVVICVVAVTTNAADIAG